MQFLSKENAVGELDALILFSRGGTLLNSDLKLSPG